MLHIYIYDISRLRVKLQGNKGEHSENFISMGTLNDSEMRTEMPRGTIKNLQAG